MSLTFRWLGAAGLRIKAGNQVLALDPFFTRPSLRQLLRPLIPDESLAAARLPVCNALLVTHAHYDHLLDVPTILRQTGATAYGSPNTCTLLQVLGVPQAQVRQVQVADHLNLGAFQVEVLEGHHIPIPFGRIFNGRLKPDLHPPLRAWDYRMDQCLGYCITVMGTCLLVSAEQPQPADVLFAVAQETQGYYRKLLTGVQPGVFIPIHWDNFTRPLSKPIRRLSRPGALALWQVTQLARRLLPRLKVIIPDIFREYTL